MTDPQVIEIQRRQLEPMSLTNSARYHAQCRSDIATLLALLIAQAAQLEQLRHENQELLARVERGATTPGTGSTAASNQPSSPLPSGPDVVCEHGVAMDVHCCGCHSGFLFDVNKCICF